MSPARKRRRAFHKTRITKERLLICRMYMAHPPIARKRSIRMTFTEVKFLMMVALIALWFGHHYVSGAFMAWSQLAIYVHNRRMRRLA